MPQRRSALDENFGTRLAFATFDLLATNISPMIGFRNHPANRHATQHPPAPRDDTASLTWLTVAVPRR